MRDQTNGEQMMTQFEHPWAAPATSIDELPSSRNRSEIDHKRATAVTEADDLLREMLNPRERKAPPVEWHDDIRRVRGLLAEWRLESD